MNNLAIIPARGGSKRIPRKNINLFLGKPIIAYSIEVAVKSGLFSEVMVSTDDPEIAEIAIKYGATVPFLRSEKNSDDQATTLDVIREVINSYAERSQIFRHACCLYPTAPLIKISHLDLGYKAIVEGDFYSVFPVVPFSYPVWRGLKLDEKHVVKSVWPEYLVVRSQDLMPVYHDAGQWYWFNPLHLDSTMFTSYSKSIVLDETEVQDIDNLTDWRIAEIKYKLLNDQ